MCLYRGDDWLGYVWGDGQYLCGKETMECGGGSAALTKTSLFLPLTPDARISSVLSRAWNVQELSRGRDVAEDFRLKSWTKRLLCSEELLSDQEIGPRPKRDECVARLWLNCNAPTIPNWAWAQTRARALAMNAVHYQRLVR